MGGPDGCGQERTLFRRRFCRFPSNHRARDVGGDGGEDGRRGGASASGNGRCYFGAHGFLWAVFGIEPGWTVRGGDEYDGEEFAQIEPDVAGVIEMTRGGRGDK